MSGPYTVAEYEGMAERVALRQGDTATFTPRQWDIIASALGMAVTTETAVEWSRDPYGRQGERGK